MSADLSVFFNPEEFAEEIAYTRINSASSPMAIMADVEYGRNYNETTDAVDVLATVRVKCSEVPAPAAYDRATFGGYEWVYDSVLSGDGLTWAMQFRRDRRVLFKR